MVAIKNIILFISAVSAAAISKRTAGTILADIETIDANVKALTVAVNNYNGGLTQLLIVNSAESTLDTSIKIAATDAGATSPLSSVESTAILNAIVNLTPDIKTALNALVNKEPVFNNAGLNPVVAGDLTTLKKDTDNFGQKVLDISSSDVKPQLQAAQNTIDGYFTDALSHF